MQSERELVLSAKFAQVLIIFIMVWFINIGANIVLHVMDVAVSGMTVVKIQYTWRINKRISDCGVVASGLTINTKEIDT